MISFARMADCLRITHDEALEGFWYVHSHRPEKLKEPGFKYPDDWVPVRLDAMRVIAMLATIEKAVGTERTYAMLQNAMTRAQAERAS